MRIRILSQVLRAVAIALVAIAALSPVPARALGTVTADGLLQVTGEQSVKNTQTNLNGSLEMNSDATIATSEEIESDNRTTVEAGAKAVVVARDDIENTLPLRHAPSPTSVSTDAELQTYGSGMLRADKHLSKVRFARSDVTLWYKQQAKLIGIIPVTLNAKATVTEWGAVELRYPWYKFLTTAEQKALEAKLEARAHAAMQTGEGIRETGTTFSANTKAHLASELRTTLAEQYELNAAVEGQVQAKAR